MASRKIDFDVVRRMALALPDVQAKTTQRGTSLHVLGRMLACRAIHKSAEPESLVVRISLERRAALLRAHPDFYYITPHYKNYPSILVRLPVIDRDSLRQLLDEAWEYVRAKAC